MSTMTVSLSSTVSNQTYTGQLTTDHAASSHGVPVLILQEDGVVRTPHDRLPDDAEFTQASYSRDGRDLGDLVVRPGDEVTDDEWALLSAWMVAVEARS